MNLYETLGLSSRATDKQIKAAHRRMAKQAHPDMRQGDRKAFERIQRAYMVLIDPARREHYDATGEIDEQGPDNAHAAALACLAHAFDAAVGQSLEQGREPHQSDLVALMRRHLEDEIAERDQDRVKNELVRDKWTGLRDRFTVEDDAPNTMAAIIESRIADIDRGMKRHDQADKTAQEALDILERHEFAFDAPAPVVVTVSAFGLSSTATGTSAV